MDNTINVILDALDYYDKNIKNTERVFANVKYFSLIKNNIDTEHSKIKFYDENKTEIFESRYEVIGIYYNYSNAWIWGWSIARLNKNDVIIVKKLLNYGLDMTPSPDTSFLKTELITSRFRIIDKTQLDIHTALASYIAKIPMIFKHKFIPELSFKDKIVPKIEELTNDEDILDIEDYQINYFYILDYEDILKKFNK